MAYMTQEDALSTGFNFKDCPNIHRSGSVRGMQQRYNWPRAGQVRVGQWVYNVGTYYRRQWEKLGLVRS